MQVGPDAAPAPTPVIAVKRTEMMIGGAGNVARNLVALGTRCVFVGVVGDDDAGRALREALTTHPLIEFHLVVDPARQTTRKVRFVSEHHSTHMLRADWEMASSVADLVRQRRRWVEGLLRLTFKSSHRRRSRAIFGYSVLCWALAPFQFVGFVVLVAWATGTNNTSPDFTWISRIWCFGLAFLMWQYMQGLKVNIAASDRKITYWWRALLMIPGIWVFATLESLGCLLGMIRFCGIGRQKESEVIAKPI